MALNNIYHSANDDELETEAIHWLVRLTSGEISHSELKKFNLWRQASPRHEAALSASLTLWLQLGRPLEAQHKTILFPAPAVNAFPSRLFNFPSRQKVMAFFLLLLSVVGCYQWMNYWRFSYATKLGEFREISLNDGSTMWLNTDSAANIDITAGSRHVKLARGEAYFDVKHNEALPFTVDAGDGHIKVLGTAFAVKIDGDTTVVTVQRGKVSVTDSLQKTVIIHPDESATLDPVGNTLAIANVDARSQLAWQKGLLVFENNTLNEIIQTLQRYDNRVLYLNVSNQEQLRLTTSININKTDDWYSQLEKALPIRVTHLGPVIWIHDAPAGLIPANM